jgi:NADPH:quinone reductase-like Zn-dependent oxidoreductase
MQDSGNFISSWPDIFGCDLAGEVIDVGSNVEGIEVGQRVLVHALRLGNKKTSNGAFQHFVLAEARATTPLPDGISFEAASALPLSLSTAAHGLYSRNHLGLPMPSNDPKTTGRSILIWGGSGSVGAATIQLAVASGLKVTSTSSPRNFNFVKSLGADRVFDYNDSSAVTDLVAALKDEDLVGAYDGGSSIPTSNDS